MEDANKPVEGARVIAHYDDRMGSAGLFSGFPGGLTVTGDDGKFWINGLVPDTPIGLQAFPATAPDVGPLAGGGMRVRPTEVTTMSSLSLRPPSAQRSAATSPRRSTVEQEPDDRAVDETAALRGPRRSMPRPVLRRLLQVATTASHPRS